MFKWNIHYPAPNLIKIGKSLHDQSLCDLQKLDSEVKPQFAGTSILYSKFLFSKLSLFKNIYSIQIYRES